MKSREDRQKMEETFRIQKQALFDSDPKAYCQQNGQIINAKGICTDYRTKFTYSLYPYNPELKTPIMNYNDYIAAKTFPVGLEHYLQEQMDSETSERINKIIAEVNADILNGTLTEEKAKSFYDQLRELC